MREITRCPHQENNACYFDAHNGQMAGVPLLTATSPATDQVTLQTTKKMYVRSYVRTFPAWVCDLGTHTPQNTKTTVDRALPCQRRRPPQRHGNRRLRIIAAGGDTPDPEVRISDR